MKPNIFLRTIVFVLWLSPTEAALFSFFGDFFCRIPILKRLFNCESDDGEPTTCSTKTYSLSTTAAYDVIYLPDEVDNLDLTWTVAFASTTTQLELTIPYGSGTDLAAMDAILAALETAEPVEALGSSSVLSLPNFKTEFGGESCLNAAQATLTLPAAVAKSICVGGSDTTAATQGIPNCRRVLCPLGTDFTMDVQDSTAGNFAPGNSELLFGTSTDCEIVQPEGWEDVWSTDGSVDTSIKGDAIYRLDRDGDGASNIVEFYGAGLIRSLYADLGRGSFGDYMFTNSTNAFDPDTDGDLLLDSFEILFGLDPLAADDIESDTDGDGLNVLLEQIYKTDPFTADTDGDGSSDEEEVSNGTDPLNDADFSEASRRSFLRMLQGGDEDRCDDKTIDLTLGVGDPSGSASERYTMQVGGVEHQATQFGVVRTGIYAFSEGTYTVVVRHRDTNLDSPDYDYCATITLPADTEGWEISISDPASLLGCYYDSSFDRTPGVSATLTVKKTTACGEYTSCADCRSDQDCLWDLTSKICKEDCRVDQRRRPRANQCPCEKCKAWYDKEIADLEWIDDLPRCPCSVTATTEVTTYSFLGQEVTQTTDTYLSVPGSDIWFEAAFGFGCTPTSDCSAYHPGAYGCLRARDGAFSTFTGQQCCYDRGLTHIKTGAGAGTPDRIEGTVLGGVLGHPAKDVDTYEDCCEKCESPENYCPYYIGGTVDGAEVRGARQDIRDCV